MQMSLTIMCREGFSGDGLDNVWLSVYDDCCMHIALAQIAACTMRWDSNGLQ